MSNSKFQIIFDFIAVLTDEEKLRYKLTTGSLYISQKLSRIKKDYAQLQRADALTASDLDSKIRKHLRGDFSMPKACMRGLFEELSALETQIFFFRLGCAYSFLEDFRVKTKYDRTGLLLSSDKTIPELLEWLLIQLWNRKKDKYLLLLLLGFQNLPPM